MRSESYKICKGWPVKELTNLLEDFYNIYLKERIYFQAVEEIKLHKF